MASTQSIVKVETTVLPIPNNTTYNIKVFLANPLANGERINYYKSQANLNLPTNSSTTTSGANNIVEIQVSQQTGNLPETGAQVSLQLKGNVSSNFTYVVYEELSNVTVNLKSTAEIEIVTDFAGKLFAGIQATVTNQGGGTLGGVTVNGNQGVFPLTQPLQNGVENLDVLELAATQNNGISIGPSVKVHFPKNSTGVPQISEVVAFDGKSITTSLSNNPAKIDVLANIDVNGVNVTPTPIAAGTGGSLKITPNAGNLKMLKPYNSSSIAVFFSWGVSLGSTSFTFNGTPTAPVAIITSVPNILSAYASESYLYVKGSFPKSKTFINTIVVSINEKESGTAIKGLGNPIICEDAFLLSLPTPTTISIANSYILNAKAAQGIISNGQESTTIDISLPVPTIKQATTNGKSVTVVWQGVPQKVLTYEIQLLGSGDPVVLQVPAQGYENSYTFTPSTPITNSDTLTVQVGAVFDGVMGAGYYSAPTPVTLTSNYFISSSSPAIFTATSLAAIKKVAAGTETSSISIVLPNGNYLQSGKSFAPSNATPFAIASYSGVNLGDYPYEITIDGSIWTKLSSNAIRTDVQQAYIAFLKDLEATSFFNAWGIYKVQEAIGRYMPQNYAELLYYNYGFDSSNKSIDIRPGTILRIVPSNFMVVPGTSRGLNTYDYLDGYVNNAPLDYDVNTFVDASGSYLLGFDAFLSQLVKEDILTVSGSQTTSSNVSGMASGADLYAATFKNPFYKLFFPTSLLSPTGAGATNPEDQFNISSATSITNIQATTSGAFTNFYFRGRSLVKISIRVFINGNEKVVPVGTTVSHLLESYAAGTLQNGNSINGLKLERSLGYGRLVSDIAATNYEVGKLYEVIFDLGGIPNYTEVTPFEMPLLHGDRLTINI